MPIRVTISGVYKRYDSGPLVLEGIDLAVAPGELFFLLGASGCGKTTLLRTVAGFIRPDAGAVHFGDQDVTALPPERRDLGMVFQNYALWPHLNVAGNVGFGLEMRQVPAAERARRIDEALELVSLSGLGGRPVASLSGGQQQRVALARALVIRPQVLLLDEPLSNLDARLRQQMRSEIRRVCTQAGVTALYVTHDQTEALAVADRIALLHQGRVEQVGTPRELYERPATRAVAGFVGEANLLPATVADGTARCALGACATTLPTGAATICVRPERLRLGETGLPGTLTEVSYQGAVTAWRVRCGELDLLVHEPIAPHRSVGTNVHVSCTPEAMVVLQ